MFDVNTFIPEDYTINDLLNHNEAGPSAQAWIEERGGQITQIEKDFLKLEMKSFNRVASYKCRALAALYRSINGEHATSIVDDRSNCTSENEKSDNAIVVNIVLSSFPQITNEVPFEAILDVRNDNEFVIKRSLLHRWIRNISENDLSKIEIMEELEWLTNEYESYMKLQDLKYSKSTIRAVICNSGELIENVIKLRFGKGSKMLVDMFGANIDLIEAERNAPGREVSFISQVSRKLST